MPELGETVRPDSALVNPADAKTAAHAPRLLVSVYPAMSLLYNADVRLGLVTKGPDWLLVHAKPGV